MSEKKRNKAKLFDIRHFFMDLGRVTLMPLLLLYRVKARTPQGEKYRRILRGGAIIAANHTGFLDPVALFVTFWYRRFFYLAAEVVMDGSFKSKLMAGCGAIRIDRNIADMEAIRRCVALLKEGHVLGVFPQGQITKTEEVSALKHGTVLMALQADVPIIPMYIAPRKKWYHAREAFLGEPIYPRELCTKKFPSTADIQKLSEILAAEMNRCMPQKEEAI